VELGSWPTPPIFEHLQKLGNVEEQEMLRTFNMGIGLIAVIPAEKYKKAKALLDRSSEKHYVIGRIIRGERKVVQYV
jgi:phosphoribosylformylglycinamidine cyclo-ligase